MIIGPYAWPMQWADIQIAEVDVRAIIEDGEVTEVQVIDLRSGAWTTVGGTLDDQISRWIRATQGDQIAEADRADQDGRIIYDREIARSL